MADFWVNGIVAQRDKQPYVQLSNERGMIAQLSMAQARNIAMDILNMAARTEMDAMLLRFCDEELEHEEVGAKMMVLFREYRMKLDQEKVETSMQDPDTGEIK
jgi:hypothetical protein